MNARADRRNPKPTRREADGNSVDHPARFPSAEVMRKMRDHRAASSDGTVPTSIDTSPPSAEKTSPLETPRDLYEQMEEEKPKRRVYNGSRHNYAGEALATATSTEKKWSHHAKPSNKHKGHKNDRKGSSQHCTLTWRMDPPVSLSDITLTVIGIGDKGALEKNFNGKKERRVRKLKKRKEKWAVQGLYLDMSQSDDEEGNKESASGGEGRASAHSAQKTAVSGTTLSTYRVVEKYHLHKVNLAVGLRSCDYFARLFRKGAANNVGITEHSIEVPLSCLPAIPDMLDYIYSPDPNAPVNATTATAVPLRYLGTLLGNRALFDSATDFLQGDLRPRTAIEYLQHAELYRQKKLKKACIRICAESFDQLKITWLASLPPHMMKRILYSRHFNRSIDGKVMCFKIASYCRCQLHKIEKTMLLSLTDESIMPAVCPEEALFFIQILIRLGMGTDDRNHGHYTSPQERSLYERCLASAPLVVQSVIESLCHGKDDDDRRPSRLTKQTCGEYSRLPAQIKVDLLEVALARQQQKLHVQ